LHIFNVKIDFQLLKIQRKGYCSKKQTKCFRKIEKLRIETQIMPTVIAVIQSKTIKEATLPLFLTDITSYENYSIPVH